MLGGAPDQGADAAKLHARDIQRAVQHDERTETKMLTRVRITFRRVFRRRNRPASP
jgi:hypothetical protein